MLNSAPRECRFCLIWYRTDSRRKRLEISWASESTWLPRTRISFTSHKTLCGCPGITWVCKDPSDKRWWHGLNTLTDLSGNMTRPLQGTNFLARKLWIESISGWRHSCTHKTWNFWTTLIQERCWSSCSWSSGCNRVIGSPPPSSRWIFRHIIVTGRESQRAAAGQLRKREEEWNPYMESRLRVMENFWDFFNPVCKEGHMWPNGADGRKVCICFHSKGDFTLELSR